MFKKGFLKDTKEGSQQRKRSAPTPDQDHDHDEASSSGGCATCPKCSGVIKPPGAAPDDIVIDDTPGSETLPDACIANIVAQFVKPREAATQRQLASLCLVSKQFRRIVRPHLYEVVQLSDSLRSMYHIRFISPLRKQPELCDNVRSVWWDEWCGAIPTVRFDLPYLCKFRNLENSGYIAESPLACVSAPMGFHFGWKEVGDWCKGVKLPVGWITRQLTTPTIQIQTSPSAGPFEEKPPTRAIWAFTLVTPTLGGHLAWTYRECKTLTHLCIDVYPHPDVPIVSSEVALMVGDILNRAALPLLEWVTIRMTEFGMPPGGQPTEEDLAALNGKHGSQSGLALIPPHQRTPEAIQKSNLEEYKIRMHAIQQGIQAVNDGRVHFQLYMRPSVERAKTRMGDMRNWLLPQWQQRAGVRENFIGPAWHAPH